MSPRPQQFRIADLLVIVTAAAVAIWLGLNVDHHFGATRFIVHFWLQTVALTFTVTLGLLTLRSDSARQRIGRSTGRLFLVLSLILQR